MKYFSLILCSFVFFHCHGQTTIERHCLNEKFHNKVDSYLEYSVPIINVPTLEQMLDEVIILDAREYDEFQVSHIPGAIHVGYEKFDIDKLSDIDKDQTLVVYCSIGYRSEKIGENLQEAGFPNVYNVYGSIFEWVNQGHQVVDQEGKPTNKVHGYNKKWSKWIDHKDVKKVY